MKWFLTTKERTEPRVRLFCFPYAGAGATVFATWRAAFPPEVEVVGVQTPGKGWRIGEPPLTSLTSLADGITAAILAEEPGPLALFGHSMGSWLALEVGRRLEEGGVRPRFLFASGRQAPAFGHLMAPLGHLADEAFFQAVGMRYGGLPREVLNNREVMETFLPSLRADFQALESFHPNGELQVEMPIVAMCGEADPFVSRDHLAGWAEATKGPFDLHLFSGGHFYFNDDPKPLQATLARVLGFPVRSPLVGVEG